MSTLVPTRPLVFPIVLTAAWFVAVYLLAQAGFYEQESGPPWQTGLVIVLPVVAVAVALRFTPVRRWARSLDPQLLIQLHAWRMIGFAFIALSANQLLAETFAVPAALGDIAIAVTAPFLARHVLRRGATPLFYAWTAFGILDLVAAVTLGILHAPGTLGILHDQATASGVVNTLPVVLIPTFVVPLMIILHMLSVIRLRSPEPAGRSYSFAGS